MGTSQSSSDEMHNFSESELFILQEYVKPGMTFEDVIMIKRVFNTLDTDQDGEVSLLALIQRYQPQYLQGGDGNIPLESPKIDLFLSKSSGQMMPKRLHKDDPLENLISQKLSDCKGFVNFKDQSVRSEHGSQLSSCSCTKNTATKAELQDIKITWGEFVSAMSRKLHRDRSLYKGVVFETNSKNVSCLFCAQ